MSYNWQQPDWPECRYDLSSIEDTLFAFAERTGRASGLLKGLPPDAQTEASIELMVVEAIKTFAIEGELLSRKDVMSSIRNNLGLAPESPSGDKRAAGAAALMLAVRNSIAAPLSEDMLFDWHRMIMRGHRHITPGQWRTHAEPMQVVSGPVGHERVHFEAPPSSQIPKEMAASSSGSMTPRRVGRQRFEKRGCAPRSLISMSSRSIRSKTAMAASAGPCPKKPCRRDSDGPHC